MTNFKVGDKVRIVGNSHKGRTGKITEWRGSRSLWPWKVTYDSRNTGMSYGIFNDAELELVTPESKFKVGDTVTFIMPDFAPWQGGKGIVKRGPEKEHGRDDNYFVEVTEVPPANRAISVGHTAWLYPEWLELAEPTRAHKFNVGDKVEITGWGGSYEGKVLTVTKVPGDTKYYHLSDGSGFSDDHLKAPEDKGIEFTKADPVNSPSHYTQYPVEVIELTRHMSFNRGNAVKYVARAGFKDKATEKQDIQKAIWYLQDDLKELERKEAEAK